MSVLIRRAKILDVQSEFHNKVVDVFIQNGCIESIDDTLYVNARQVIEGNDLHISQGWVDVFADYREPGNEHKETIETGLQAAAAGGFTDVLLAPNTNPPVSTKSVVRFILQKAKGNAVNLHPLGSITSELEGKNLAEMLDMHANGAIAFTDGWKPVQTANLMLKALEYAKSFDGVLLEIPVDASLAAGGLMHEGVISTRLGMPGVPVLAETILIHRDLELLRYTNSKLHITGVSTAEGVQMIRKAKQEGLNVTCSVTPYHLTLTDVALQTYNSMYKVSPVLRSESDRMALIAGLEDDTIDCIASHHRPQEWDAKAKEFEYAGDGMNLQEIVFPLLMSLGLDTSLIVEKLTRAPRAVFQMKSSPVNIGNTASITIFQPSAGYVFSAKRSLGVNNPYIGKPLPASVLGIISNNQVIINKH